MKKELLAVALILAMVFAFSACGGGGSESPGVTNNEAHSESEAIDLGEKILVDDDYVTVKAIQFYTDDWNGTPAKFLQLKVTNNLDREILFNLPNGKTYIGDEQVEIVWMDGNSGPLPGKTNTYSYRIYIKNGNEEKELDSLEELYDLNGKFEVQVYTEDKSYLDGDKDREYDYSLNEKADNNSTDSLDTSEIDSMLQGDWSYGSNAFSFNDGSLSILENGSEVMSGDYTINTNESNIVGTIHASDRDVKITLPYSLEDGVLHIQNNKGEELTHK